MSIDGNRPPYVTFETRGIEDRNESIAKGHYVEKDIDIAVITRPGSRDTLEKEANTWLNELREKGRKGEIPPNWYEAFSASYKSWKSGETGAVNGTPIKGWSAISAGAQKTLIAAGILSVEDLAEVPDSELQNIGTGAASFKQKAKTWLEAANGVGKIVEQNAALSTKIDQLADLVKKQAEEITALRAKQPVKI